MSDARDEILRRIRTALRDVPAGERPEDVAVERAYRTAGELTREQVVAQFEGRVAEYKATVHRVTQQQLAKAISDACRRRGVRRLITPEDLPRAWLPRAIEILRDESLTNDQLDSSDGVLTGCALGIAQTGTIVLDAGKHQGRRALTLIPDYHLCVVRESQIVELVPEAFARLGPGVRDERRPLTFISGPSATSDIELNRVEGVHGPRTLEVLILGPRTPDSMNLE
jgi:L-lactate dehydrogenase complex protein LldG